MVLNIRSKVVGYETSTPSGSDRVFNFIKFENGIVIENAITSGSIAEIFDKSEEVEFAYFKVGKYFYIAMAKIGKEVLTATTTRAIIFSMIVNFIPIFLCFGTLLFFGTFSAIAYFLNDFAMAMSYGAIIGTLPGAYYLTKFIKFFLELKQCKSLIK